MEIDTYILPAHWAGALINDDYSSYEDDEIEEIKKFISSIPSKWCLGCSDESYFSTRNDANNLGSDVLEYYFKMYEGN